MHGSHWQHLRKSRTVGGKLMSTNKVIQNMLEMTQKSYEILRKTGDLTQNKRIRLDERVKTLQEVLEKNLTPRIRGIFIRRAYEQRKGD